MLESFALVDDMHICGIRAHSLQEETFTYASLALGVSLAVLVCGLLLVLMRSFFAKLVK